MLHYSSEWFVAKLTIFPGVSPPLRDGRYHSASGSSCMFSQWREDQEQRLLHFNSLHTLLEPQAWLCICVCVCLWRGAWRSSLSSSINNILHVWHTIWWLAGWQTHKHVLCIYTSMHICKYAITGSEGSASHRVVMIVILFALWRKSYINVSLMTFSLKEPFSEVLNSPRVFKKKKNAALINCQLLRKLFFHCIISSLVKSCLCSLYTEANMSRQAELLLRPSARDLMSCCFGPAAASPPSATKRWLSLSVSKLQSWPFGRTASSTV